MHKYLSILLTILQACNSKAESMATKYIEPARKYVKSKNMNDDIFILIDLSKHSGKNRFYVYSFSKNEIIMSCLVSHGCGNKTWSKANQPANPVVSNELNSHCSSIGKYKIGERGYSQWGNNIKYLLHGLESSNSNAAVRNIVLHSWGAISEKEIYPLGSPEGWGCPAISNSDMSKIDKLLKNSKPTLMWVIN